MPDYTVLIEEHNDATDTWQALAPPENVTDDGTAEEVGRFRAGHDTNDAAGLWRVRVWEGADADLDQPEAACSELERS